MEQARTHEVIDKATAVVDEYARQANIVDEILVDVQGHLGAVLAQTIPSDDRINAGHVNAAYERIKDALIVLRQSRHLHRGGGKDIDQCGLCKHDIRHEIHSSANR